MGFACQLVERLKRLYRATCFRFLLPPTPKNILFKRLVCRWYVAIHKPLLGIEQLSLWDHRRSTVEPDAPKVGEVSEPNRGAQVDLAT